MMNTSALYFFINLLFISVEENQVNWPGGLNSPYDTIDVSTSIVWKNKPYILMNKKFSSLY